MNCEDQIKKLKIELEENFQNTILYSILLVLFVLFFKGVSYIYTTSDTSITDCENYSNCISIDCPLNFTLFNRTMGNCACNDVVLLDNKVQEVYICSYENPHFDYAFLFVIFFYYFFILIIMCYIYHLFNSIYVGFVESSRLKQLINRKSNSEGEFSNLL